MSDFAAINDAIKKQYGFDSWSDAAALHLAARSLAFGPLPSAQNLSSFELERRVELPEDRPGFHFPAISFSGREAAPGVNGWGLRRGTPRSSLTHSGAATLEWSPAVNINRASHP